MYRCTISLTSALDGVGGQTHVPAAFPLEKNTYPLCGRLGGPQDWSEECEKSHTHRIRSPETPEVSKSLYRLCYPSTRLFNQKRLINNFSIFNLIVHYVRLIVTEL
jgi:hypothetical protein